METIYLQLEKRKQTYFILHCHFLRLLYVGLRFQINLRKFIVLLALSIAGANLFLEQSLSHTTAAWLRRCGRDAAAFPLETAFPL